MADLRSPRLIYVKGVLFLLCGILSAALLLADRPDPATTMLLGLAIWSFCRFYYFAFYVIHHYVDESYHFAGLWDFAKYLMGQRKT